MKTIFVLTKKELRDLFASPIAYVFITVFLMLSFWFYFSSVFVENVASLRGLFGWLPVFLIILLPAVTMGQWAEEKKSGTIELLMTLPARETQVVLGKLLASTIFLFATLLLTTPALIVMAHLGDLDVGEILGGYIGIFLLGVSYLSVGLWISSLTKNQIVAFIVTVIVLFVLFILGESLVTSYLPTSLTLFFQSLSFSRHYASLARGVVDLRDVVFFVSVAGLFVYLTRVTLSLRKV